MKYIGIYKIENGKFKSVWTLKLNEDSTFFNLYNNLKKDRLKYHKNIDMYEICDELLEILKEIDSNIYSDLESFGDLETVLIDEIDLVKYTIINQMIGGNR